MTIHNMTPIVSRYPAGWPVTTAWLKASRAIQVKHKGVGSLIQRNRLIMSVRHRRPPNTISGINCPVTPNAVETRHVTKSMREVMV